MKHVAWFEKSVLNLNFSVQWSFLDVDNFLCPSSVIVTFPQDEVSKQFNTTGLVAAAKACSDKIGWLRCSQHAQAGTKKQLCQYCQNKQTFVAEVMFPLNRFPSVNLPVVWGICRQRNLHPFLHLFQYCSSNYCKLDVVLLPRVCNTSTIFEEPCEASVGELALKACSILYQVYSSAWFNKVDSPTDEHGCAVEHLALPCSQQALCSHDTAPLCSTC